MYAGKHRKYGFKSLCELLLLQGTSGLPVAENRMVNEAPISFIEQSKAPFTLLRFRMKTEKNLSVLALRSHCAAVKTELFENANENA